MDNLLLGCHVRLSGHATRTTKQKADRPRLQTNAHRQAEAGYGVVFELDATYKLVLEGHAVFLLGTRDIQQTFHLLGMAISVQEDEAHSTDILTQVGIPCAHSPCLWVKCSGGG